MNLDLQAKTPFERVRLFLKLYSLPVFVAIFGIATYCVAYEKAYEYKTQEVTLAQVSKPEINPVQEIQAPQVIAQAEVSTETLPEIEAIEEQNEVLGSYLVEASALNVRSKASTQSKINAKLYRSDSVEVIGVEGEWAQLENGWVLLKYLSRA